MFKQNRKYSLLSNVLSVVLAIMGTTRTKYDYRTITIPPLQCGEFDQQIEILYGRMVVEVINVLCHFLSFTGSFSQERAHNMVALMLDPHFEGMDCIMDYIGNDEATILMQQYDELVVMPLLKVVMEFLNPNQAASSIFLSLELPLTSTRLFWIDNFNTRDN